MRSARGTLGGAGEEGIDSDGCGGVVVPMLEVLREFVCLACGIEWCC